MQGRVLKAPTQPAAPASVQQPAPSGAAASPTEADLEEGKAAGSRGGADADAGTTPQGSGRHAGSAADAGAAEPAGSAAPGTDSGPGLGLLAESAAAPEAPGLANAAPGEPNEMVDAAAGPLSRDAGDAADIAGMSETLDMSPAREADTGEAAGSAEAVGVGEANGDGSAGGAASSAATAATAERGARAAAGTLAYVDAGGKERRCSFAADQVSVCAAAVVREQMSAHSNESIQWAMVSV